MSNFGNISILQSALDQGIIDLTLVQKKIDMTNKKEILKKHPYEISQWKDGYWHTYIQDGDKRKAIKKKEKADLEKVVIDYWKKNNENNENNDTFRDRFNIWMERQRKCGRSDNTIYKYECDYKRFIAGDIIEDIPIQKISEIEISEFITRLLSNKEVQYRALKGLFGYINGVFEKAIRDKLVTENPCRYVDLPLFKQFCKEEKVKQATERTVSKAQRDSILRKVNNHTDADNYNIARLAVEVAFYTGMRVGELSGLMWDDIDFDNGIITIQRSEKHNRKTKEYYISLTKNHKVRYFPMTDELKAVFRKIKKIEMQRGYVSEYVFSDANGRIHSPRISECARSLTMTKEFEKTKSIHAIRRTLNSNLRCNGVSATVASSLLGHTERVNDQNYTYDITSMDEKKNAVKKACK